MLVLAYLFNKIKASLLTCARLKIIFETAMFAATKNVILVVISPEYEV